MSWFLELEEELALICEITFTFPLLPNSGALAADEDVKLHPTAVPVEIWTRSKSRRSGKKHAKPCATKIKSRLG